MGLIDGHEGHTDGGGKEQTHSLVQKLWGEHAPYKQVIAQGRHQNDVRRNWERTNQCVAEASATQRGTAVGAEGDVRQSPTPRTASHTSTRAVRAPVLQVTSSGATRSLDLLSGGQGSVLHGALRVPGGNTGAPVPPVGEVCLINAPRILHSHLFRNYTQVLPHDYITYRTYTVKRKSTRE